MPSPTKSISTREIWSLTWPQALMMLCQFLVGFTDVVVAGLISEQVQAAFGLIVQCQFFLLVVAIAINNSGIAAMSQSLGAGLALRAERYIGLIFSLGGVFCTVIVAAGYTFRTQLFSFIQVPPELWDLTNTLWIPLLAAIPANYLVILTTGIFRARKNVAVPLASSVVICLCNIVGDLGLGLGYFGLPHLGAIGLIISTVFSLLAGGMFNLYILRRSKVITTKAFAPLRWQRKAAPYLIKVAIPAGVNQLLWQLGYMVLFFIAFTLPNEHIAALAGLTAGMRIESLFFLPGMAFSFTGSILVGHCLGAGNKAEARRVGLRITASGVMCMSLMAALLFPFIDTISGSVAANEDVKSITISYMHYNLLAIPFTVTSMILTGILTGAGATVYPMLINSLATWFVRLPIAWYMGHVVWQNASGIFLAMLISQAVQATSFGTVFLRANWYRFAQSAKKSSRAPL